MQSNGEPMEAFLGVVCHSLNTSLFQFDPKTHEGLVSVAIQVVNSKPGSNIMGK